MSADKILMEIRITRRFQCRWKTGSTLYSLKRAALNLLAHDNANHLALKSILSKSVVTTRGRHAGTAFYTYPGCELIDFVAPTIITKDNQHPTYSAVLVSIKSRLYLPPKTAMDICDKLKKKADDCNLTSALCIVCVFGQTSDSDYKEYNYDASNVLSELAKGDNVDIVLCLPQEDRFGLTDIFLEMTATTEQSELLSSHSFFRARSLARLTAQDALRSIQKLLLGVCR
jgi:hypothetical protein